jgi:hypothetical protein
MTFSKMAACWYAECHYAECRYAECRWALFKRLTKLHVDKMSQHKKSADQWRQKVSLNFRQDSSNIFPPNQKDSFANFLKSFAR